MRVLALGSVYPPHLLGGYEVIWQGVTRELRAAGHDTRVLVSGYRSTAGPGDRPPGNPARASEAVPEDPHVHRDLQWYWEDHRWPRLSWRRRLAIERHNATVLDEHLAWAPDVVAFWPMGGMSLSLITRVQRAGVPCVFFVLDPWTVYGPRRDAWLAGWSGPLSRRLAPLGEALWGVPTRLSLTGGRWIFCSEWMRQAAPVPGAASTAVLTPGIESRFLLDDDAPSRVASEFAWRLLYLGRVVEQKGVITAVDALAALPEATLTIIGTGDEDYLALLATRAAQLGVEHRVRLLDPVDRDGTVAAYAAADVVLHPVLWGEPWGLVPLEAMGVGRPVVATGRGGSGDFLVDGENALLVEAGDAVALAAAVTRLADDEVLRARLVAGGRRTAAAHTAAEFDRAAVRELLAAAGDTSRP